MLLFAQIINTKAVKMVKHYHKAEGQQFNSSTVKNINCSLKLLKFLRCFRFMCASKRAFDYLSILAAF